MHARVSSFLESGAELLAAEAGLLESGAALLEAGTGRASAAARHRSDRGSSWSELAMRGHPRRPSRGGARGRFRPASRRSPAFRLPFQAAPTPSAWRPALAWAALVGLPSIASRESRASIASYRSTASVGSAWSLGSVLSVASLISAGSLGSFASAGSILSIGSSGSILSIGSSGGILAIGPVSLIGERDERSSAAGTQGPDPAVVRRISGLLAMAAIASAPFTRRAA